MTSGHDPRVAHTGEQPDGAPQVMDDPSLAPAPAGSPAPQSPPAPVAVPPAFPPPAPVAVPPAFPPPAPPVSGVPAAASVAGAAPAAATVPPPAPAASAAAPPARSFAGSAATPAAGATFGAEWEPSVGYPRPYTPPQPHSAPAVAPPTAGPVAAPKRRLAWPGVTALLLVVALGGVAGFQARQIEQLRGRLAAADRRLADAQAGDRARLDALDRRATQLEKQADDMFNPEAIAAAVLPSVFRVSAGEFTGTAFAVGKPAAGGGTYLFTNFHVVESVWEGGDRQVFIERREQRFPATIVKVDKVNDVAQLKTDGKFTGLVTAGEAVKSGQQIVVVGAPLGLEDTVTTGVVSAFRKSPDGSATVIQFDAPINPGNSGGPVINRSKQVVGIATAKARDAEGIGLAVPIKIACDQFKIC